MRKAKRLWIKQEKQTVKLLYRKGLLKDFKIKELYWNEYYRTGKMYRSSDGKYKHSEYFPEVHYSTTDYFGECDEHSIVSHISDLFYWENVDTEKWDEASGDYPESTFKYRSRKHFINYLRALKTVKFDNKIKALLIRKTDY